MPEVLSREDLMAGVLLEMFASKPSTDIMLAVDKAIQMIEHLNTGDRLMALWLIVMSVITSSGPKDEEPLCASCLFHAMQREAAARGGYFYDYDPSKVPTH